MLAAEVLLRTSLSSVCFLASVLDVGSVGLLGLGGFIAFTVGGLADFAIKCIGFMLVLLLGGEEVLQLVPT